MGSRAIARQPRRQERLRRFLAERRDRGLQAQPAQRRADPAEGGGGLHRRQRRRRMRDSDRPRRSQLGRGQPRRPQRLRDLAGEQLDHHLPAQPEDRRADPAAGKRRLHRRACRSRSAPSAALWSGRTWSSSAPRARTSTSAPSSATRSPSSTAIRVSGALTQPGDSSGCIAEAISGCALGIALGAPEGMAISGDGASVYVASALSNAVVTLARDQSTGNLTPGKRRQWLHRQQRPRRLHHRGRAEGRQRGRLQPRRRRLRHLAVQQQRHRLQPLAQHRGLAQKQGTAGCLIWLRAAGCSFGRALRAPEGLAISPDGDNVYVAAFANGAIDVLDRGKKVGKVKQVPGRARLPRAALGAGLHARRGRCAASARSRSAPTAVFFTRPRSAATPSTSSGGTNER